jgi:hypothetical protein
MEGTTVSSAEPIFTEVVEGDENSGRYPIPQGWATPTELTHILRVRKIVYGMAPQQIYTGFIRKPGSGFPYKKHIDGRTIVPIEDSIRWIVQWLQEKAEKEAAKATAAARKAAAAALAANITNETITDQVSVDVEIEGRDEWSEWGDFGS